MHPTQDKTFLRSPGQTIVVLLLLSFALSFFRANATEEPPFLDKMVNSGTKTVSTYQDILDLAQDRSGKKVEVSSILQRWIALGKTVNSRVNFDGSSLPLRKYLDLLIMLTDLDWHYDASRDTIIFDFAWHRPSSQPARELLQTVLSSTPPKLDVRSRRQVDEDAWRVAFDALICKNETAHGAWMTRAEANASVPRVFSPGAANYLCSGQIFDDKGREFAFVATHQPMQLSPGEGTIGFYLFAPDGTFISGAVFSSGWRCSDVSGRVLADGKTFQIKGWHNGTSPSGTEYTIKDGKLTYLSSQPNRTAPFTLSPKTQALDKPLVPFQLTLAGPDSPGF